jgi:citrate lyase subunit beta / citryl-CoA lyase
MMIDSYFFIPGDKEKYLDKIGEIDADYFVIDLEESVSKNNKMKAFENAMNLKVIENTYVRVPFSENVYSKHQLITLINKFEGRIVLPKVQNNKEVQEIVLLDDFQFDLKLIILVENPICFINLLDIIKHNTKNIHAIGFGSHDFCSAMSMKHDFKHLNFYRKQLILWAKAFDINYIDGVDLDLKNFSIFIEECIYAFEAGSDGKFIIHPSQLKSMKDIQYFSTDEINRMNEINHKISLTNADDIDLFEFDGIIYEKPHLKRIKKWVNRLNAKK